MESENDRGSSTGFACKVHAFRASARDCAMVMLDNASFIQKELPNVRMNDVLRAKAGGLCEALIGTKHDVIHELFELDDLMEEGRDRSAIASKIDMILRWIGEDVEAVHPIVMALAAESQLDRTYGSAYLLVCESAGNILTAFNAAATAADACSQ